MRKLLSIIGTIIISSFNTPPHPTVRPGNSGSGFSFINDLSSSSSSSSSANQSDYFRCNQFGPFPTSSVSDISVQFTYKVYIGNMKIIERIRLLNKNNSVLSSSSKASFNYTSGNRRDVTFTIPLRDYWTSNGLTLKFEILNASSYSVLKTFSATFYPPESKTISFNTIKHTTYTSPGLGFFGDGTKMKAITEQFNFKNISDYFDVDYYYRLDLNRTTFGYSCNAPSSSFTCGETYLRFEDRNNFFPFLTHTGNNVKLPLNVSYASGNVSFSFANRFYINKRTLQISSTYRNGFVLTNDFYLPVNGRKFFNGKTIYIDISHLGLDDISTSIPLKYDISQALVGACNDGRHCIVGGME